MRALFTGLLVFATGAASAVQISFDNIPGRGYADASLVYQEDGFTITSDPWAFPDTPDPLPHEFFPGSAWSVADSSLRSCATLFPSTCAFTLTHSSGTPFLFQGFGALTSNSDWCNAVSGGVGGPTSGLTLNITGSLGAATRFSSVQDVSSCSSFAPVATTFGSIVIDTLTVSTIPLNFIRIDDITVSAVPEPGTYALMLLGLLALSRRVAGRSLR